MAEPVIVVGAGPAGTRAAQRLLQAGLRPVVIDENERQGGQIYRRQPENFIRPAEKLYGTEAARARALHADFESLRPHIDYRPGTTVWGVADEGLLSVRGSAITVQPFSAIIIASGATDRIMPLPGWTTPGVYSLGASQIALKAQACAIGGTPVFMGTGPLLYLVAWQYLRAGVTPAAVLDTSSLATRLRGLRGMMSRARVVVNGVRYMADLMRAGVKLHAGITPQRIEGREDGVTGVLWQDSRGRLRRTACDAVGTGYGLRAETQLADLLKCDFMFDRRFTQWRPQVDLDGRTSRQDVYLAGDGVLLRGADAAEAAGRLAACALLQDRTLPVATDEIEGLRGVIATMDRFAGGLAGAFPWPAHLAAALPDETVVCRCENVTAGDIRHAATALDSPEINRAKALMRPGMGRCQGRMCGLAAAEILAAARGVPVEQVGRIRTAAPLKPLPLDCRITP
ncbi:NAD(P)/FAD-dependent oxidoreductase [Gluconacetobacter azotocaptans]|uniref:NAD(P)/FAD-dependent oxidoreductase n=1 Tax=Gluconacetobacter azotocaptans TaxID=142834 RepID=A0A7W4JPA8_9PROT|nr:FAD/NAD(P)-binding oxidoreductase [Gluconacetobacter azotocaptans]MBB2188454.1 NAD(P)/FAD-dependent oxidoreductase [Gluconacetobacter azotocaptans]GBQ27879.1 FAD-dependent pyridine nucleotide-disulfide oxidoreductase [Gluconacetobacter azotocaptans DSM 13594]